MGLSVSIYKDGGESYSNGGVSQFMDAGVIVNIDGPSEPDNVRTAPLMLVRGAYPGIVSVVPAELIDGVWIEECRPGMIGPMMGGCYVSSPDGRFTEAVEKITGAKFYGAVPLHDRFETPEQYRQLSAD